MQELVELGVSWIWMGLESPQVELQQAAGSRHAATDARTARARHQAAGIDDRRPGASHAGKHHGGNRARGGARYRFPPVHALHAGAGHAAVSADGGSRDACCATSITPTFTASSSSISSTPRFRATTRNAFWTGRSAAISRRNGPSLYRISRTMLAGWRRYKNYPDARVRDAFRAGDGSLERRLRLGACGPWNASSGK